MRKSLSPGVSESGKGKDLNRGALLDLPTMKIAILVSIILAFPLPSMALESSTDFHPPRVMYGPWNLTETAIIGFEAKIQNQWWLHSGPERVLDRFAQDSTEAASNGVTYIASLYYHAAPWDQLEFDYTHAVHLSGIVEPYTPSPLDETWWLKAMHEPAVAVANLSLHYPIWGLVWDIELYGHSAMERNDYSYDLLAVGRFADAHGLTLPPLAKNGGYYWLKNRDLLGEYHAFLSEAVYEMAKETEVAVHSINPNLSLGLLGFIDSWHHWTILRAFNSSTAPVTAWTEFTYGGYVVQVTGKTGEEGVGFFQEQFEELGLNGKVMPGIRPHHDLGKFLYDLGFASRHNGAFWIYQHNGNPFSRITPETYVRMYQILDEYIYFNTSDVFYLPTFHLHPGAITHPYVGPGGEVSLLIYTFGDEVPLPFRVMTDSEEIVYVGENLTEIRLDGPNPLLRPVDLPCMLAGLDEEDLSRTEAWALIEEIRFFLTIYGDIGLEQPPGGVGALAEALDDHGAGRYGEVISSLLEVRETVMSHGMDAVWPMVEEGFADPRNSEIPLDILRLFSLAESQFSRDDDRRGELNFIKGLQELESVAEPASAALLSLLFLPLLRPHPRKQYFSHTPGAKPCINRSRS